MTYHLTDKTCINISLISMPEIVFTQLKVGFIITKFFFLKNLIKFLVKNKKLQWILLI